MSRIGKNPISVPPGVKVEISGSELKLSGPKGTLNKKLHPLMRISLEEGNIWVKRNSESKLDKSLHGLTRTLVNNMVKGVTQGFDKSLAIVGVGYKAELVGKKLSLSIGYSHPILFKPPEEIKFTVENPTRILVSGVDKELVGQVAAKIRSFRPPEPYKGKGIRYETEVVRKKAGKTAA